VAPPGPTTAGLRSTTCCIQTVPSRTACIAARFVREEASDVEQESTMLSSREHGHRGRAQAGSDLPGPLNRAARRTPPRHDAI